MPQPSLADAAYAHALAMLGDGRAASEAAIEGMRRGGRSRSLVLGHTRAAALEFTDAAVAPSLDGEDPEDLVDLARALAFTRPPDERAIVDLDTRHGLDRAQLGRALGIPAASAALRAAEVMLVWQRELDPVVLARLGAGGCEPLAELLATQPSTLGERVAQGPVVNTHAETCSSCRDRLLAMVSVRTLLAQQPIEPAPAEVRAAGTSPRYRAGPPPPPIAPFVEQPARRLRWLAAAGVVAVALIVAVIGGAIGTARRGGDETRVEALTKVPAAGATIDVTPSLLETNHPPPIVVRNLSGRAVEWTAKSSEPWLTASPTSGHLRAGAFESVTLALSPGAPEGELRGSVTFTANDGSTAIARLRTVVSRAPDVATNVVDCRVTAAVEDDSEVDSVTLHWRDELQRRTDRSTPMTALPDDAGYQATLPQGVTWWVSATDALGNTARTGDQGPC